MSYTGSSMSKLPIPSLGLSRETVSLSTHSFTKDIHFTYTTTDELEDH